MISNLCSSRCLDLVRSQYNSVPLKHVWFSLSRILQILNSSFSFKMIKNENCRVLSIQSTVVSGYVGNKSATFPLQVLGFDVDPINSVQLSNHTGYPSYPGQILESKDLQDLYEGLSKNDINKYSHLLTGYVGSKSFLTAVSEVIKDLKRVNPDLIYVCDPVLGDDGLLYVPSDLVQVYKESILCFADILTPNQFEAELLTDMKISDIDSAKRAMEKLHSFGVKVVVISSSDLDVSDQKLVAFASTMKDGKLSCLEITIPRWSLRFTGTGDLFAALLLAWSHIHKDNLKLVLETVMSTIHAVLKNTIGKIGTESHGDSNGPSPADVELKLIQSKKDIENPSLIYTARFI